jgi:hypothetical protein
MDPIKGAFAIVIPVVGFFAIGLLIVFVGSLVYERFFKSKERSRKAREKELERRAERERKDEHERWMR